MLELVGTFLLVGALAFGGCQAALPLVERLAVGVYGWVTPAQFGTAVGLSYATPGPVLIIAAYIGYRTAGLAGALAATVAVFTVPLLAAVGAASAVQRLATTRGCRRSAAPPAPPRSGCSPSRSSRWPGRSPTYTRRSCCSRC